MKVFHSITLYSVKAGDSSKDMREYGLFAEINAAKKQAEKLLSLKYVLIVETTSYMCEND